MTNTNGILPGIFLFLFLFCWAILFSLQFTSSDWPSKLGQRERERHVLHDHRLFFIRDYMYVLRLVNTEDDLPPNPHALQTAACP